MQPFRSKRRSLSRTERCFGADDSRPAVRSERARVHGDDDESDREKDAEQDEHDVLRPRRLGFDGKLFELGSP